MFNNCNSETNGEQHFYNHIKNNIQIIFDVGCRSDSEFINFEGDVHYFDPVETFVQTLSQKPNQNKNAYFNGFGLGNENKEVYYFPRYQSFFDRVNSCHISDDSNKILLKIKTAKEYILENNIQTIDFLKIDTEGYELNVLQGFEEYIKDIKIIQFEYGGTFLDNKLRLIDVVQYLENQGFHKFSYLVNNGVVPITDFNDHYQYCNIVCINKSSDYIPY
jgi:FkbM family methyltransferase